MGSNMSPLFSEIFMDHFENNLFNCTNPLLKNIKYYYRYVDDIICLWTGTNRQLNQFHEFLNDFHPNLTFKMELEHEHSLNFLDLTITITNQKHSFKIFRKPTQSDMIIPYNSNHIFKHKLAAFHSWIHRLFSVPMSKLDFNLEVNTIKKIAVNNGYNPNIINKLIKNKEIKNVINKVFPQVTTWEEKIYVSIPYIGPVSKKIGEIFKKYNMQVAYKTNITLQTLLPSSKSPIPLLEKSGIYQLQCKDCNAAYVGQTGRKFSLRFKEHARSWRLNLDNSTFANHLIQNNHSFDPLQNYKILHIENKGNKMNILENLEILKLINNPNFTALNEHTYIKSSSIIKICTY